jgi:hypothetical protein
MTAYNAKINTDGQYRTFCGWSTISMVENDLKFIENYMKNHSFLKKYFSALPSSSYHMTIYNIWSNGSPFLKHQKNFIDKNFPKETREIIKSNNRQDSLTFFNPDGCINDLLYRLQFACENSWDKIKLEINYIYFSGNTIGICLKDSDIFSNVNICRKKMFNICGHDDHMGQYHITLAYKYKDIDKETEKLILNEVHILNMLLNEQTITLNKPYVCCFSDMTSFKSFTESLTESL